MRKQFDIPAYYKSSFVTALKTRRRIGYTRGARLVPIEIALGSLTFKMAFHFGLCFGVENAIDIAYKAIEENPGKRIYLLSQMIHNPHVNADLTARGVQFLMSTEGEEILPFSTLSNDDVVIVPAFGTSVETFTKLRALGSAVKMYDTTCPFVEKVWRRAEELGKQGFSVVIHGKHIHEETRATFSHAHQTAKSLVVRDFAETELLCSFIRGEIGREKFLEYFSGKYSEDFDPDVDLQRIGVVNQTTMLASETQAISAMIKQALKQKYGESELPGRFADTRDTLCYATNENQSAMYALLENPGDLCLVVGGFNSSNTSHLVEIAEQHLPCFYIEGEDNIRSLDVIEHYNLHEKKVVTTENWTSGKKPLTILISAGASCPDAHVEAVIEKIAGFMRVAEELSVFKATI